MTHASFKFQTRGEDLVAHLTARELGLDPARIWNPSPSTRHRTEPWDLPRLIRIGIRGFEETGAKYSPPPFAVGVEGADGERALVAVRAQPGWHGWNRIDFDASADGLTVRILLEGQTPATDAQAHVRVELFPAQAGESWMGLLARGLASQYPDAAAGPVNVPDWHLRPIYCGWGDQVTASMWLEGVGPEPRALAYAIQGLYERWIRRLDQAEVPFGTTTIDAGWSPAGVWRPHGHQWPDLKAFIAREHDRGRRVLLWLATWYHEGLPDDWCVHVNGQRLTADPTHPDYRAFLRESVHELLSPDGYDADGFKIDQLAYSPSRTQPLGGTRFGTPIEPDPPTEPIRLHEPGPWGVELLHQLQKDIYDAGKAAKPDCLITSSTVHPYFHDTFDMVRIHDMGHVAPDIFAAMQARIDLAHAALPGKPIDTDDWIHTDYDMWLDYTMHSHRLGVPCIFYAERFMKAWKHEPATVEIPMDDLKRIAKAWKDAGY